MHLERLAQYWDDLDDWFWLLVLKLQKLRRLVRVFAHAAVAAALTVAGVVLATIEPPLALALAVLMFVALLYRAVTGPIAAPGRPS